MQHLNLQQAADYLEAANVEHTHDAGHALAHFGTNAAGARFVLINDCNGNTVLTEAM